MQANVDECAWDGTVNHWASENDSDDSDYWESEDSTSSSGSETDSEDEFFELEGEELVKSLERQVWHEVEELEQCHVTGYEAIQRKISKKEWKIAEQLQVTYTGNSDQSKQRHNKKARDKEVADSVLHKSQGVSLMWSYFAPKEKEVGPATNDGDSDIEMLSEPSVPIDATPSAPSDCSEVFTGYISDMSAAAEDSLSDDEDQSTDNHKFQPKPPPPLKQ
ncbi:hypothetical protein BDQ17DRAFT_1440745 [Cyathus striatus]|nr:hypothetical protein BDQ17DRAFT_1440745 [Cyathus striatus]